MTRAERHAARRAAGWRLVGYRIQTRPPIGRDSYFSHFSHKPPIVAVFVSMATRPRPVPKSLDLTRAHVLSLRRNHLGYPKSVAVVAVWRRPKKPAVKTLGEISRAAFKASVDGERIRGQITVQYGELAPFHQKAEQVGALAVAEEFARRVKLWFPAWGSVAHALDAVLADARKEAGL